MDKIKIKGLKVFAHHGVYAEETKKGQNFFVDADLYTGTRTAGLTDELEQSTNYGVVCHFITRYMTEHTCKLLEAVAENLAEQILLAFPLVEKIRLEICKPEAPIGLPFETVSVEVFRGWHSAYVALGSNMGDRENFLEEAVKYLKEDPKIKVRKISDFIETKPYGGVEQPDFLNGVMELVTLYDPEELLHRLQTEENLAKRKREVHWGPRTLDLDLLFYDDYEKGIIRTEELTVPHPDLQNRDFVLKPMCQIAPFLEHPVLHKSMQELWEQLQKK
ncbi:MAG: 2-amino-4-hydroxy-6-hydroxymethyldihydropteridine diphosphokinase [Lachnospiraceae bacterium]|nr:2-amino-4-hydroxy-6-hydroxymethyldihydropteridine diphosphokinase [Lachnospiraceae bacterium]